LPSRLAETASALFAKNLLSFVSPHFDKESGKFAFDSEDATVQGTLVCADGKIANDRVADALKASGGSAKKAPASKKTPAAKKPAKKTDEKTDDGKGT